MNYRSALSVGLLPVALCVAAGTPNGNSIEPSHSAEVGEAALPATSSLAEPAPATCRFAIRARNNLNLNIWIDLYDSTVLVDEGPFRLFNKNVKLEIQNHRLTNGQSMDRRYTAAGACDSSRNWTFYVRIDRPSGIKNHKLVFRRTEDSGDRTVDLGASSTWGL